LRSRVILNLQTFPPPPPPLRSIMFSSPPAPPRRERTFYGERASLTAHSSTSCFSAMWWPSVHRKHASSIHVYVGPLPVLGGYLFDFRMLYFPTRPWLTMYKIKQKSDRARCWFGRIENRYLSPKRYPPGQRNGRQRTRPRFPSDVSFSRTCSRMFAHAWNDHARNIRRSPFKRLPAAITPFADEILLQATKGKTGAHGRPDKRNPYDRPPSTSSSSHLSTAKAPAGCSIETTCTRIARLTNSRTRKRFVGRTLSLFVMRGRGRVLRFVV
jgi:hypothetical protein